MLLLVVAPLALGSSLLPTPEPATCACDRMLLAAARDLPPGRTVTGDDLVQVPLPADLVPTGVFSVPEQLVGRVPAERILAGELIRTERLAPAERGLGLNALLPEGHRAVTIPVTELPLSLAANNRVDVLGANGTLVEDLTVLEVGPDGPTLAVPLQAVGALARAPKDGLWVTLRPDAIPHTRSPIPESGRLRSTYLVCGW